MNKFNILAPLVALPLLFSTPTFADEHQCEDTQLGSHMKDMKEQLGAYVDAFKADDKAEMQKQLDSLIASVEQGKNLLPQKFKHVTDAEKQVKQADYTQGMEKLQVTLNELKQAESKKEIKAALGKIKKHSKSGHKAFRIKCD